MDDHTLQQVIDLAVKTAVLKAKKEAILECRPIGSYFITETEDDPNILFGGEWQKLTGRYVLQCSDDSHKAGTTVEAGLPNITGAVGTRPNARGTENFGYGGAIPGRQVEGAFTFKTNAGSYENVGTAQSDKSSHDDLLTFNASRSNPIYGRSDTVQPPARIVNVWKRVS